MADDKKETEKKLEGPVILRVVEEKPTTAPQYISREEQERIINEGGSVLFHEPNGGGSRICTKLEHLPHAAEIAIRSKSPEAMKKAKEDLDQQIAALEEQKAKLHEEEVADKKAQTAADKAKHEADKAK